MANQKQGRKGAVQHSVTDASPSIVQFDENLNPITTCMPTPSSVRLGEIVDRLDDLFMQAQEIVDDLRDRGIDSQWAEATDEHCEQYTFSSSDEKPAEIATLAYLLGKISATRRSYIDWFQAVDEKLSKAALGRETRTEEKQKKRDFFRELYAKFISDGGKSIKDLHSKVSGDVGYSTLAKIISELEDEICERARGEDCRDLSREQQVSRILLARGLHPGYTQEVVLKALSGKPC